MDVYLYIVVKKEKGNERNLKLELIRIKETKSTIS